MDLNRLRILAGLEPVVESAVIDTPSQTFFVYSRCLRKSDKLKASNIIEAVEKYANAKVESLGNDPLNATLDMPAKFKDGNNCEYVSYPVTNEAESLEDFTALCEAEKPHDSDIPKVTFMDKTPPANTLVMTQVEFNNDTLAFNKTKMGVDIEESDKIKVPADVMKHLNKRIKELKASIETYDEKGYDDKSVKSTAIDCLEKIKKHLEAGNREEYKQAQVYYGTLMSPIFDMFPTQLINFLHSDKDIKKAII